jgi:TolA-binding protein
VDLTTALTAMGGIGTVTILQQAIGWFLEERRKDSAEARAAAAAPVTQQSLMLEMADTATTIQQRAIKSMEDQLAQVQLEVGTLRAENTDLREQMATKDKEISRLYARIGKLEVEIDHLPEGKTTTPKAPRPPHHGGRGAFVMPDAGCPRARPDQAPTGTAAADRRRP